MARPHVQDPQIRSPVAGAAGHTPPFSDLDQHFGFACVMQLENPQRIRRWSLEIRVVRCRSLAPSLSSPPHTPVCCRDSRVGGCGPMRLADLTTGVGCRASDREGRAWLHRSLAPRVVPHLSLIIKAQRRHPPFTPFTPLLPPLLHESPTRDGRYFSRLC